ncbi:MAG: hypothetical protein KDE35_02060 [Geminicoccaceae bacterium]|nr:hypothetical protein [Geminicoccaceae bacterium]
MATKTETKTQFPMFTSYDASAMRSIYADNVAVAMQAQRVMLDAAEATMTRQFNLVREMMDTMQSQVTSFDMNKKPEAYVADVKAVAERAQNIVKNEVDNGLKVQQQVADLVSKRMAENVEASKKFAA